MHPSFADWYRLVEIEPRAERLDARWEAVESTSKDINVTQGLELVRVALGKRARDPQLVGFLREEIRKSDPTFPASGGELEIAVFAGSVWANVLVPGNVVSDVAALAMHCTFVQRTSVEKLKQQFHSIAQNHLAARARSLRALGDWSFKKVSQPRLEQLTEPYVQALRQGQYPAAASAFTALFEKLEEWIKNSVGATRVLGSHAGNTFTIQQEQSEVAWWILGEYSRDLDLHLSAIPIEAGCLLVAKELADLTTLIPGPASHKAILDRMLRNTKQKASVKVRVEDAINAVERPLRQAWTHGIDDDRIDDLVPLHFGLLRSLETDRAEDWIPAFRKGAGVPERKAGWPAVELAEQFYSERLLIRSVREEKE